VIIRGIRGKIGQTKKRGNNLSDNQASTPMPLTNRSTPDIRRFTNLLLRHDP